MILKEAQETREKGRLEEKGILGRGRAPEDKMRPTTRRDHLPRRQPADAPQTGTFRGGIQDGHDPLQLSPG